MTVSRPATKFVAAFSLAAAEAAYGNVSTYEEGGTTTTLTEHLADARAIAGWLADVHGVGPGDRVAVASLTNRSYVALWHAAILGHFVIVPINIRLSPAEVQQILVDAEASLVFSDDSSTALFEGHSGAPLIGLETLPALVEGAGVPPAQTTDLPAEDAIVAILYTGGTTGTPKGVILAQQALATVIYRIQFLWDIFSPGSCVYSTTSLFHVSGINVVLGPVLTGGRTVLTPTFDVPLLVEDCKRLSVTHLALAPVMIDRFLDAIEPMAEGFRHIRFIIYGGAPISQATINRMRRLLPDTRLQQNYGMTEAMGAVTLLTDADHRAGGARLGSAGRAVPGCAIVPMRPNGTPCDCGEAGELFIRIDSLMAGYWRNDQLTREAIKDDMYRSGDVGYLDALGYVYVVDRLKDMIVTGGENVYSVEVERAIEAIDGVRQVAVFGIPSREWGEQVHAVVVPHPGAELTHETVRQALEGRLARYKQPKSIDIQHTLLPVSGNSKVAKAELRRTFWQHSSKGVN